MPQEADRKQALALFRALQRHAKKRRTVVSHDLPRNQHQIISGQYDPDRKTIILYQGNHTAGDSMAKTLLHEQIHAVCDPFTGLASEAIVSALERFLHPHLSKREWDQLWRIVHEAQERATP
jgi:hypothetical protein